jgi:hypothetical protein
LSPARDENKLNLSYSGSREPFEYIEKEALVLFWTKASFVGITLLFEIKNPLAPVIRSTW